MPDLDRELRGLTVEWPETPDVAAAMRARVAAEPARSRRVVGRGRPALAYALAGLLAAAAIGLAASPSARSAILEFFGLRSVRVERREPRVPPGRGDLRLGQRVSLAQARERAGFDVLVPAALGAPNAVHLAAGDRVTLTYDGMLVQQFRASVEPLIGKAIGEGTRLERFRIDGDPAYFISGRVHGFAYLDEDGDSHFEDQRLAGNTLLVERDGLLLRVEGRVSRERAVTVVQSMR